MPRVKSTMSMTRRSNTGSFLSSSRFFSASFLVSLWRCVTRKFSNDIDFILLSYLVPRRGISLNKIRWLCYSFTCAVCTSKVWAKDKSWKPSNQVQYLFFDRPDPSALKLHFSVVCQIFWRHWCIPRSPTQLAVLKPLLRGFLPCLPDLSIQHAADILRDIISVLLHEKGAWDISTLLLSAVARWSQDRIMEV